MQIIFFLISLMIYSTLFSLFSPVLYASEKITLKAPSVNANAWILLDYDSGMVLAEGNADKKLDPASLTKIMTSYIVGQKIKTNRLKLSDIVTVGKDAWATGNPVLHGSSVMFLKPGDKVSVSDLNKGVIIQSGNDACIALADYIAGSQDLFIKLMNEYAKKLGLTNTKLKTVHGLDALGQFSTARDIAILSKALIHDVPDEYAIHKEKEFTFNKIRQFNRNRLLWSDKINVDGIKTGNTAKAGYNLVASAIQGNMRLISVILGTKSDIIRFHEAEKLLIWGFRFFENVTPVKSNTIFTRQHIWFGDKKEINLGTKESCSITIPRGQVKNLKVRYILTKPQLTAPLKKGQIVGVIDFQLHCNSVKQCPLITMETVEEGGIISRIRDFIAIKLYS